MGLRVERHNRNRPPASYGLFEAPFPYDSRKLGITGTVPTGGFDSHTTHANPWNTIRKETKCSTRSNTSAKAKKET